jgi:uncharacterized cupredoxin-like copper-binding protein
MRLSRLALVPAAVLLVAACSTAAAPTPSSVPAASPSAGSPAVQAVEVTLSDSLRMDPATMTFRPGRPIHFVITNTGSTNHEFYLGDEAAQTAHDGEMGGMAGMTQDEAHGIGVMPGETKTLDYTFAAPGTYQAGCHLNGHYAAGMRAAITVTS